MIQKTCSFCQNQGLILTDIGFLCESCFNMRYTKCDCCNNYHHSAYIRHFNGENICVNCFNQHFYMCPDCSKMIKINSLEYKRIQKISINGQNEKLICSDCFNNKYDTCDMCGSYIKKDDLIFINDHKHKKICKSCRTKLTLYTCSRCGAKYIQNNKRDNYEDNYCYSCKIIKENVKSYSYKPRPKFMSCGRKDEKLWMGVEIEFQNEKNKFDKIKNVDDNNEYYVSLLSKASYLIQNDDEHEIFYQKHDGSIGDGIEMVSEPLTLNYWHKNANSISKLFLELIQNNCRSDTANKCGMHVHITKALSREQIASLVYFINKYKPLVEKIAGRKSNHYSQYMPVKPYNEIRSFRDIIAYADPRDRYSAINLRNENTIEYRIFQSVLDPCSFYKNIEFVHASYNYVKNITLEELISKNCWYNFVEKFIKNNPNYYFLYTYIKNNFKF